MPVFEVREHEADDPRRRGAERHTDADLHFAPADRVRRDAVEPEPCQQQCETAEESRHNRKESFLRQ